MFDLSFVAAISRDVEAWKAAGVPVDAARRRVTHPAELLGAAMPEESNPLAGHVALWLSVIHVVYTLTESN